MDEGMVVRTQNTPRRRAADYRDVYSNSATVRIGPWDFSILFAHLKEADGQIVSEDQATVTLAPQQFKAFTIICSNMIAAYEAAFGALALPPTFKPDSEMANKLMADIKRLASSNESPPPSRKSRGAAPKKAD